MKLLHGLNDGVGAARGGGEETLGGDNGGKIRRRVGVRIGVRWGGGVGGGSTEGFGGGCWGEVIEGVEVLDHYWCGGGGGGSGW